MASAYMVGPATNPIDAIASTSQVSTSTLAVKAPQKKTGDIVKEYFKDNPIMAKVSWCESRFRQTNKDGSVFRGIVNNDDVGVMQINTHYHLETAKKMGLDIMTLEGNLAYGKYLYEKEGTDPWISSSACWKQSDQVAYARK